MLRHIHAGLAVHTNPDENSDSATNSNSNSDSNSNSNSAADSYTDSCTDADSDSFTYTDAVAYADGQTGSARGHLGSGRHFLQRGRRAYAYAAERSHGRTVHAGNSGSCDGSELELQWGGRSVPMLHRGRDRDLSGRIVRRDRGSVGLD